VLQSCSKFPSFLSGSLVSWDTIGKGPYENILLYLFLLAFLSFFLGFGTAKLTLVLVGQQKRSQRVGE